MCRQTESHSESDASRTNRVAIGGATGWGWGWAEAAARVLSFRLGFALNERGREKVLAEV